MTDLETYTFVECETCSRRTGTPTLCGGCLHNREQISLANRNIRRLAEGILLEAREFVESRGARR